MKQDSFDILHLSAAYQSGAMTPEQVVGAVLERIGTDTRKAWIQVQDPELLMRLARALADRRPDELPLYGIPFAIKDNIDLAGVPTSAGCPGFTYVPEHSAPVVERLIQAGAIPIGKTNLDQFATGLSGTRSPYGTCQNAFDPRYISGGSSSGSAVSVALGHVSFALGTDTAGSGRVPAALNHLIGFKPTRGLLSTRGVVPACRSLDTVSIFGLTADDAHRVFAAAIGFDAQDSYSRIGLPHGFDFGAAPVARLGIPRGDQREFLGCSAYAAAYGEALEHARHLGARLVEVDFAPFFEVAGLLYHGPWLAERYQAIRAFADSHPQELLPVTRDIILAGAQPLAADAFAAQYRLRELKRQTGLVWRDIDALFMPTVPHHPRIDDLEAAPLELNLSLGMYTNFVNLLDYAAVALPVSFLSDGLPFGVTLAAPAHQDLPLLRYAQRWQESLVGNARTLGATGQPLPVAAPLAAAVPSGQVRMAFCASGSEHAPLWAELDRRGGRRIGPLRSAPAYRRSKAPVRALPHCTALLPAGDEGATQALDLWEFGTAAFGALAASIEPPWAIGAVLLENGTSVRSVICATPASAAPEEGVKRRRGRSSEEQFR